MAYPAGRARMSTLAANDLQEQSRVQSHPRNESQVTSEGGTM